MPKTYVSVFGSAGDYLPSVGGGPVELASDTFERADSGDLGANWTPIQSNFDIIVEEACADVAGNDTSEAWTALTWPNDQYSQVVLGGAVGADGAGTGYGPGCRWNETGTVNGYRLVVNASGWELVKFIAGSTTSLSGGVTSTTFAPGDTVRLSFTGTNWTITKNGSGITGGTGSDAQFATGDAAICYSSTSSELSNGIESWSGGSS